MSLILRFLNLLNQNWLVELDFHYLTIATQTKMTVSYQEDSQILLAFYLDALSASVKVF